MKSRFLWVLSLGAIGFITAAVFAIGPAVTQSATLTWSASDQPPRASLSTPLLLTTPRPGRITVDFRSEQGFTLETAVTNGLVVSNDEGRTSVWSRGTLLGAWTLPGSHAVSVVIGAGRMTLTRGTEEVTEVRITEMPEVRFIQAIHDDREVPDLEVEVLTGPTRASPSRTQVFFGFLALLSSLGALWVGLRLTREGYRRRGELLSVHPADVAVFLVAAIWMVLAPAYFDDGWVMAQLESYHDIGGFSSYYAADALELPFGYWFGSVQRLFVAGFTQPLFQRLTVLALLLGGWVGIRLSCREIASWTRRPGLCVVATVYMVGFAAWGSTLRPEPAIALLASFVMLQILRFRARPNLSSLTIALLLSTLAVTAHPSGVIALAPILVSANRIYSWAVSERHRSPDAISMFLGFALGIAAIGVLVFFLDSDLTQKAQSISAFRADGEHSEGLLQEALRYRVMDEAPYSPAVRRGFVALFLISAAIFVVAPGRARSSDASLPGMTIVAALLLLTLTPSKWPWHFGTLIAYLPLAFRSLIVLRRDDPDPGRLRGVGVLGALVVAGAWSWTTEGSFNQWDLQSLAWHRGGFTGLPIDLSNGFLWLAVAAVLAGVAVVGRGGRGIWPSTMWMAVILSVSWVAVPAVALAHDAITTPGWTFARQNWNTIVGDADCGLADETRIPKPGTYAPLAVASTWDGSSDVASSADPYAGIEPVVDTAGAGASGPVLQSQWHTVPAEASSLVVPIKGDLDSNALSIEFGARSGDEIELVQSRELSVSGETSDWTLYAVGSLGGEFVRISLDRDPSEGRSAAAGTPAVVQLTSVSEIDWTRESGLLVRPNLRQYFPCETQPSISSGYARAPRAVIDRWDWDSMPTFEPSTRSITYFPFLIEEGQVAGVLVSDIHLVGVSPSVSVGN